MSAIDADAFEINPEQIELASLITTIIKNMHPQARKKNLELRIDNQLDSAHTEADKHCIEEAISNLVDNAIKYTEEGAVVVAVEDDNGDFVVKITDTGIGMSDKYLQDMYDSFSQESTGYTKKFQGIGLGLALTKRYLDLNNIPLEVESQKGEGTTFTLYFKSMSDDLFTSQAVEVFKPLETAVEDKEGGVALIVEDDVNSQQLAAIVLKDRFPLKFATSVSDALQILKTDPVRLVLLDLSLDGNEDGLDLTRTMRKSRLWKKIPVIAVTAHAFETDRDNCLAVGCNDYLAKPIKPQKLLSRLDALLGNKHNSD